MKCFVVILFLINNAVQQKFGFWNASLTPVRIRFYLSKSEVIPHLIKKVAKNIKVLQVAYGRHKMAIEFNGRHTVRQIAEKPTRVYWEAVEDAYYALMLVGPDCPTYKDHEFRSYRHWTVVNILGNNLDTGDELTPYEGIGDIYGPGVHRLVFLLYRQPGIDRINFTETRFIKNNRSSFKVKPFTWAHRFWDPIEVNFFSIKNLFQPKRS